MKTTIFVVLTEGKSHDKDNQTAGVHARLTPVSWGRGFQIESVETGGPGAILPKYQQKQSYEQE